MLAYERLQTIIGRVVYPHELAVVASVFGKSLDFFCKEESTEPWQPEPKLVTYQLEITDPVLNEQIFNCADELGISPDDLITLAVKWYCKRQGVADNATV